MRPREGSAPKHGQECDASPGLRDLSKPAPRGRMRGVLEATPLALTETCSGSADRPLPRGPLSGGGLRPRSLALPLSQHSRPTDLGLAIISTMYTPCRSCAINTFVKTRGPPTSRGTRVRSKSTRVPELLRPLPRSTCSIHQECAKSAHTRTKIQNKTKQNKTKQNKKQTYKQSKQTGSFSKPWTCHWWETQAGAHASLPGRPALPLPTTVLDSRPTMYW